MIQPELISLEASMPPWNWSPASRNSVQFWCSAWMIQIRRAMQTNPPQLYLCSVSGRDSIVGKALPWMSFVPIMATVVSHQTIDNSDNKNATSSPSSLIDQINQSKLQCNIIAQQRPMLEGKASYIISVYFFVNVFLVIAYPLLRLYTVAGERSLKHEDSFGFTYENSIIYTVLAIVCISYIRSTSNSQFLLDSLTVGKVGVACLLFMAKFDYCLYYILICLIAWIVVPYPRYRGPNKFKKVGSLEQYEELMERSVSKKDDSRFQHMQYRNKMMYFVEFYADWMLPCTFTKELWYAYSNLYSTDQLEFLSINVSRVPQIAEKYQINTSGFTKQLPTVMMIEDGEQVMRFPPVDKNNKVPKVAKYDYKVLLRYFDLESRYIQTRK